VLTLYHTAYRAEHFKKIAVAKATYYAENREMMAARGAIRRAANPEKIRVRNQNRRAVKRAVGGKLSHGLADKLFKQQHGLCACGCGGNLSLGYHLDHRMPLYLGGSNTDDNIQLLIPRCNLRKGRMHPDAFFRLCYPEIAAFI
jgi:5-methylcytosine-specific restriction endonuclease McrA